MIEAVRTPDERFENLPGFDFDPNYVSDLPGFEGLRMHYLDVGPADAEVTYLCLHGQPTWSYLYRKMIPVFEESGARVIAPDLFGFGRSDKPVKDETYTFHFHRNSLLEFVKKMDLKNVTLVVQDWGGVLGLTLPHEMPERFSRLIIMNTMLGLGLPAGEGFLAWKAYNASQPDMDIGGLMGRSTPTLTEGEIAAYAAPFPDVTYKGGVRRFPELVPIDPEMEGVDVSKRAAKFWSEEWQGDSFMAIGMQDPVIVPPVMKLMHSFIRNCPEPMKVDEAGHFVQEWGDKVAKAALAHFDK